MQRQVSGLSTMLITVAALLKNLTSFPIKWHRRIHPGHTVCIDKNIIKRRTCQTSSLNLELIGSVVGTIQSAASTMLLAA